MCGNNNRTMKNFKFLGTAALASLLFVSCEQTNFDLDIPFNHSFTENVVIKANEENSKSDTTFFSASSSAELEENLSKVSTLDVEKVLFSISNMTNQDSTAFVSAHGTVELLSGDLATSYGTFIFAGTLETLILTSPLDLKPNAQNLVDGIGNVILNELKAGKEIAFIATYFGSNNTNQEYSFDATVDVKFKAVASVTE